MRLCIGYGNALRRDDGVALHVVAAVAARAITGVQVERVPELVPELAELVARMTRVVFVDAALDAPGVVVRTIRAASEGAPLSHAADPRGILALAASVYGTRVEGFVVTIAAHDCGVGEGLSEETAALVDKAVSTVISLLSQGGDPEPDG